MTQFAVFKNPNPASRKLYPYILDIQSDLLSELKTTIVIPLCPSHIAATISISRLNPLLEMKGEAFMAITQNIAGIDRSNLGTRVCDLTRYREEIIAAIDFALSGI